MLYSAAMSDEPEPTPEHDRPVRTPSSLLLACLLLTGCVELFARGSLQGNGTRADGRAPTTQTAAPNDRAAPTATAAQTTPTSPTDAGAVSSPPGSAAITNLALGENHTCSLDAAGRVRCWGYNMDGQLGIGSTQHPGDGFVEGIGDSRDGPVRAIAAGGYQTCALTTAGRVWCWGQNHEGQVGTGEATDAAVRTPVRVQGVEDVVALELGEQISCAITRARALYCWGNNSQHEISDSVSRQQPSATRVSGVEPFDLVTVGNYHLCVVRRGRVTCRGELATIREVDLLEGVTAISSGWGHTCAISAGVPYCWGKSYLGVLGRGNQCLNRSATCDADVMYPPTEVPGVSGAVAIDGHDYHSCVRLEGGGVTCWGNNQGHSFTNDLPAEPWQTAHVIRGLTQVESLVVGGNHFCVIRGADTTCFGGGDGVGWLRGTR
jgi:alpha-tubulin suppressor-like RCC1 family protein